MISFFRWRSFWRTRAAFFTGNNPLCLANASIKAAVYLYSISLFIFWPRFSLEFRHWLSGRNKKNIKIPNFEMTRAWFFYFILFFGRSPKTTLNNRQRLCHRMIKIKPSVSISTPRYLLLVNFSALNHRWRSGTT